MVSLTTTFLETPSGNYGVGLILVEDGVTGTGNGYNQSNAYSGGGNGPMGGYEDLPSSVPASLMVYDHVARGILPSYDGYTGAYTTPAQANDSFVINAIFDIDQSWDLNHMHLVAFAKAAGQQTDNAGLVTIEEAETNGFVPGVNLSVQYLEGPDATFTLYPNPAADVVTASVSVDERTDVIIEVINSFGQVVSREAYGRLMGSSNIFINTRELSSGLYTVSLITGGKRTSKNLVVN